MNRPAFVSEFVSVFGWTRRVAAEPHVCSRCCHEIDDEACPVPLMLFSETSERAWVYCDGCACVILGHFAP